MNTIKLNTNLSCANCVKKITPLLDAETSIQQWNVDLEKESRPLTVYGNNVSLRNVRSLLKSAGYEASVSKIENGHSNSFWLDIKKWKRASLNTLNCLIGCSIGDFAMIIFLQAYYPGTSMTVQMILAVIAGLCTSVLLETILLKIRENFDWNMALKTAISMSFISMIAMEVVMNITDFMITGGKAAFSSPLYWLAIVFAMIAGFIAPLPYNYYKLKKFNKACH